MGKLRTVGFRIPDELDWAIERLAVDARIEKRRIAEIAFKTILALAKKPAKECIDAIRSIDEEIAEEIQDLHERLARARAELAATAAGTA